MNWTQQTYKHYSAEHLHKADKAQLATESIVDNERLPQRKQRGKRLPHNRK